MSERIHKPPQRVVEALPIRAISLSQLQLLGQVDALAAERSVRRVHLLHALAQLRLALLKVPVWLAVSAHLRASNGYIRVALV